MVSDVGALLATERARAHLLSYVACVDAGDTTGALALFAPDARLRGPDGTEYSGRGEIAGFFAMSGDSFTRHVPGQRLRHHLSSLRVTLAPSGGALATSYFLAVATAGPDHWGRYRDELVADGDGWLITRRKLDIEGYTPDGWYDRHQRAEAGA